MTELGGASTASADHRARWIGAKCAYAELVADRPDYELAQTFFNSVTRRLLTTVGVDPAVEFVEESEVHLPTDHLVTSLERAQALAGELAAGH